MNPEIKVKSEYNTWQYSLDFSKPEKEKEFIR